MRSAISTASRASASASFAAPARASSLARADRESARERRWSRGVDRGAARGPMLGLAVAILFAQAVCEKTGVRRKHRLAARRLALLAHDAEAPLRLGPLACQRLDPRELAEPGLVGREHAGVDPERERAADGAPGLVELAPHGKDRPEVVEYVSLVCEAQAAGVEQLSTERDSGRRRFWAVRMSHDLRSDEAAFDSCLPTVLEGTFRASRHEANCDRWLPADWTTLHAS